jgi:hypothetical protein
MAAEKRRRLAGCIRLFARTEDGLRTLRNKQPNKVGIANIAAIFDRDILLVLAETEPLDIKFRADALGGRPRSGHQQEPPRSCACAARRGLACA